MADRPYSIAVSFKTEADLAAATKTEQAIKAVGTAARKASNDVGGLGGDLEAEFAKLRAQLDASKAKLGEQGQTAEIASGRSVMAFGAISAAVAGAGLLVRQWIRANEDLSDSFSNLGDTAGGLVNEVLKEAWGEGSWLREAIDKVTVSLGGQTAAMKRLNEPLAQYAGDQEKAADATGRLNDELKDQEAALKGVAGRLREQLEVKREQLKTEELMLKVRAEDEKAAIDASRESPEVKAGQKAAVDKRLNEELLAVRNRGRAAPLEALDTEAKARANELAKTEAALAEQRRRVGAAQNLQTAQSMVLQEKDRINKEGLHKDPVALAQWQRFNEREAEARRAAAGIGSVEAERAKLPALEESAKRQREALADLERKRQVEAEVTSQQQARDTLQTERENAKIEAAQRAREDAAREAAANTPELAPEQSPDLTGENMARAALNQGAQATGNAGEKMNLEGLSAALRDGADGGEKEQLQQLIDRLTQTNTAAATQLADKLTQALAAINASQAALSAKLQAADEQIQTLKSRQP